MTATPPPGRSERVAAGAAWLDEHWPGWWEDGVIDLDRLDLANKCNCVLGQLWPDIEDQNPDRPPRTFHAGFDWVAERRDWWHTNLDVPQVTWDEAWQYGFREDTLNHDWLTGLWADLIENRRNRRVASTSR